MRSVQVILFLRHVACSTPKLRQASVVKTTSLVMCLLRYSGREVAQTGNVFTAAQKQRMSIIYPFSYHSVVRPLQTKAQYVEELYT